MTNGRTHAPTEDVYNLPTTAFGHWREIKTKDTDKIAHTLLKKGLPMCSLFRFSPHLSPCSNILPILAFSKVPLTSTLFACDKVIAQGQVQQSDILACGRITSASDSLAYGKV